MIWVGHFRELGGENAGGRRRKCPYLKITFGGKLSQQVISKPVNTGIRENSRENLKNRQKIFQKIRFFSPFQVDLTPRDFYISACFEKERVQGKTAVSDQPKLLII